MRVILVANVAMTSLGFSLRHTTVCLILGGTQLRIDSRSDTLVRPWLGGQAASGVRMVGMVEQLKEDRQECLSY
jgi:hypothetical protein